MSTCILTAGIYFSALAQPTIATVSPLSGKPGTTVTITGTGFDPVAANNIVFFGGVKATVTGGGAGSLTVTVPDGAQHSYISVLNSSTLQIGNSKGYFLPTYDNGCYIPGSSKFKSRTDITVTGAFGATSPRHAAIGDMDGDGKPDLVVSTYGSVTTPPALAGQSVVNTYLNNSTVNGVLSFNSTPYVCTSGSGGVNVKLGDLDGDGKLDIVVACGGSGRISLIRNTSTGFGMSGISFATKRDLNPGIEGIQETALADFDGDGKLDIAAISDDHSVANQLIVYRNRMTTIPTGIFPGDCFGPLAPTGGDYSSFLVSGDPTHPASSLSVSDFDRDGKVDVVVGVTEESVVSVVQNISAGAGDINFSSRIALNTGTTAFAYPTEVITTDLNADGKNEIVVANYFEHDLAIFENIHTTGVLTALSYNRLIIPLDDSVKTYAVTAGDFDGNGNTDIALSVNSRTTGGPNNVTVVYNTHSGSGLLGISDFNNGVSYNLAAGADNQGITAGDIDLDSKADIVVASYNFNRISVLENTATPDTSGFTLSSDSVCMYTSIGATATVPCVGETSYWSSATGRTSLPVSSTLTPSVTGVSAGIDTIINKIVYLSDTNYVRRIVEVKAAADTGTISGPSVVCQNYQYLYTNTATGGTWSSSNPSVATINAVGRIMALTPGTATISYTNSSLSCGSMSATKTITVNATPDAGTITGPNGTCVGTSISLNASVGGGTWGNLNTTTGTMSSLTSTSVSVLANTIGADTIIYYLTNGLGCTDTAFKELGFVNPGPSSPSLPIEGTTTICPATPTTLSNGLAGGTWSSANTSIVTINPTTGVMTGLTAGTTNISYSVNYGCGASDTFTSVTVLALPDPGTISGLHTVYLGNTISLTTTGETGGTWTSSNTAVATISGTGATVTINSVSLGSTLISYSVSNSCAVLRDTHVVNVLAPLTVPVITSVTPLAGIPQVNTVTITGDGFDPVATNNSVYFGATRATVTSATTTSMTVTLPLGALYTNVSYTNLSTLLACAQHGFFLPTYNNTCYVANTSTFKPRIDVAVTSPFAPPSGANPRHATLADMDGDGLSDLVVSTYSNDTTSYPGIAALNVYRNIGSIGTVAFASVPVVCTAANGGINVKIGDLDGDGKLDVVVAASGSGRISCIRNTSTGVGDISFSARRDLYPREGCSEVAIADIDGDGKLDISAVGRVTSHVKVFRNQMTSIPVSGFPNGFFGPDETYDSFSVSSSAGTPGSIYSADFDGDGRIDLVTSNTTENMVSVLRNTSTSGSVSFAPFEQFATGIFPAEVIAMDVNGDTKPEIAVVNYGSSSVSIFDNLSSVGSLAFNMVEIGTPSHPYSLSAADFDGDLNVDLVIGRYQDDSAFVLRNAGLTSVTTGSFTFGGHLELTNGVEPQGITAGDIDNDKKADIVTANYEGNSVSIFRNTATPQSNAIVASEDSVCVNASTLVVYSPHCSGATGYWSTTTGRASIVASGTGIMDTLAIVTGVTAGADTIVYSVVYLGDTAVQRFAIDVKPLADTGTITGGAAAVCINATIDFNNTATGVWSSSNTSVATVDATTGIVTGVAAGTTTISFTAQSFSCGPRSATRTITVNPLPDASTITASASGTCVGQTLTLSATATNGTGSWISSDNAVATVTPTGAVATVTGVATGSATIYFIVNSTLGCGADTSSQVVGVVPASATSSPITGGSAICQNDSSQLSNSATGGSWSSSNTAIATVDATTGMVHAVAAGSAIISYTAVYPCTTVSDTMLVTVSPLPATATLSGTSTICIGSTASLTASVTGGIWSTSNASVATVDGSGNVFPVSGGTADISYTITNSCGFTVASHAVTVNTLPSVTASTAATAVCAGSGTTLTAGGADTYTWAPSATLSAATGDVVTATPIANTTYTVTGVNATTGCSNAATVAVNVNALPTVNATAGSSAICEGSTTTLSATGADTYSWTPAAAISATTGSVVTFSGTSSATYTVTGTVTATGCTNTAVVAVTVNAVPTVGATAGAAAICAGQSTTLSATGAASFSWSPATGLSATTGSPVTFNGTATTTYTVTGTTLGCSNTATVTVTVNALPSVGAATTAAAVCAGSSATLTATGADEYSWSPAATLSAATGTPVTATPTANTTYTVTGTDLTTGCSNTATVAVSVNALPPVAAVAGASTICSGNTTTLSVTGADTYSWSPATGISAATGDVVTFNGTSTTTYTVTGTITATGCTNTATVTVTVNPTPTIGAAAGTPALCDGQTTTLSATGGTTYSWSPATGISATTGDVVTFNGTTTSTYTVTGTAAGCSNTAVVSVTVNPLPSVSAVAADPAVCIGSSTTLTATGADTYSWTPATGISATTGDVVIFNGTTTSTYSVTGTITATGCNATASVTVTINNLPNVGDVTGTSLVCISAGTTSLSNTVTGGTWSMTNGNATIDGTGLVTLVSAGVDTAVYTVTNACGSAYDSFVITIDPLPFAGTISGNDTMCITSTITLTSSVAGGAWFSTNSAIATIDLAGVVSPVAAGTDTIMYVVSNACGNDTAWHTLVVSDTAIAGFITAPDSVCLGAPLTLTNTVAGATGGVWSSTTPLIATVDATTGEFFSSDTGMAIIRYTVTTYCGTKDTVDTVYVKPLPFAGTINGIASLCAGATATLTNATTGGVWTSSNISIITVNTTGVVTGVAAGTGIISYAVTNSCGTAYAMDTIDVLALPVLTSGGGGAVCSGAPFSYTPVSVPVSSTYDWTRASVAGITPATGTGTGAINETLTSTDTDSVTVVYTFTMTASGCVNTQNVSLIVKPTPVLSSDTSLTICSGSPLLYGATSATENTLYTWVRPSVTGVTPATNAGTNVISETLFNGSGAIIPVVYNFTLTAAGCSNTQRVHADVEPAPPAPPVITTHSPSYLCQGTMYQNFGTATTPPAGISYTWSSVNAQVWATGNTDQYCLVNFTEVGTAWVYVSSSFTGFACQSRDSFAAVVYGAVSDNPEVWLFNNDFVCTPSDENSYQWGYDDANTLDSTLLAGETNQHYYDAAPDLAGKLYWCITSRHGCMQKTYYRTPTGVVNVTNGGVKSMNIFPNPNDGTFHVEVASDYREAATMVITNVVGEKVMEMPCMTNGKVEVHLDQPAGIYMVTVNTPHGKTTGKVTIVGNN